MIDVRHPAQLAPLIGFDLVSMAADTLGNLFTDIGSTDILEYSTITGNQTALSGNFGFSIAGLATDNSGNLYVADENDGTILRWSPTTQQVTTLISGLSQPTSLAVDTAGDVIFLNNHMTVEEWSPIDHSLTTLFSPFANSFFSYSQALAVDVAGNVYVADPTGDRIEKWSPVTNAISSITSPLWNGPTSVAVDGSGNLYVYDSNNINTVFEWSPATNSAAPVDPAARSEPFSSGVAVDTWGDVYFPSDTPFTTVEEIPRVYLGPAAAVLSAGAGTGTAELLSENSNWEAQSPPTSNQPWLTVTGTSGGQINYSYTANTSSANRTAQISLLGQEISFTQSGLPAASLAATSLVEGPSAGSDSVTLVESPTTATWTATSNASWLHVATGSAHGTGSATVAFTFDAAAGNATRTGTITIAGLSLTVTQAPANYLAAGLMPLVPAGLGDPSGIAVDSSGNLYVSNDSANEIEKWSPLTGKLTTLVSTGLSEPEGLALDAAGDLYIADTGDNAIKELSPAGVLTTLVSTGLSFPTGVAVDGAGNVDIADTGHSAIKQYSLSTQTVTTLISSGLQSPEGIAVDSAGNVYVTDSFTDAIEKWSPTSKTLSTLISTGQNIPDSVAVDSLGNVYVSLGNTVEEWTAATKTLAPLISSGLSQANALAVDGNGKIDIADSGDYTIKQYAANQSLTTLVAAVIDNPTGIVSDAAGNVYFADDSASVIREWSPATGTLSTLASVSNPRDLAIDAAGNLYFSGGNGIEKWSAASKSTTILTTSAAPSGPGLAIDSAGNLYFNNFAGTVQEWSPATGIVTTLVSTGLSFPSGLAIDAAGNLYIADPGDNAIKEWSPQTNSLVTLVSTGLNQPAGITIDESGNLYISDEDSLERWSSATGTLTNLGSASSGVVAVDPAGNLYVAGMNGSLSEVPRAYFGPATTKLPTTAGTAALGIVPANVSLAGPLAPTSDRPWLTIGSVGGPAGYSYTANTTGAPRTAHISLLGQSLTLTQPVSLTVSIGAVPSPRNTVVSSLVITFSEPVNGFSLANLQLSVGGGPNLLTASQTLTTSDSITWTLANLSGLTGSFGAYTLTLSPAGIKDSAGNSPAAPATTSFSTDLWQNVANPLSVDGTGNITPIDALVVINYLNVHGAQQLTGAPAPGAALVDVNGDGNVSPIDALEVINYLNALLESAAAPAAAEATAPDAKPNVQAASARSAPVTGNAVTGKAVTGEPVASGAAAIASQSAVLPAASQSAAISLPTGVAVLPSAVSLPSTHPPINLAQGAANPPRLRAERRDTTADQSFNQP